MERLVKDKRNFFSIIIPTYNQANFLKEAFGIFYVLGIILLILIAVAAFVDKDR